MASLHSLVSDFEDRGEAARLRTLKREEALRKEHQQREDDLRTEQEAIRKEHEQGYALIREEKDTLRKEHEEREERIRNLALKREEALRLQLRGREEEMRRALTAEVEKRAVAEGKVMAYREQAQALGDGEAQALEDSSPMRAQAADLPDGRERPAKQRRTDVPPESIEGPPDQEFDTNGADGSAGGTGAAGAAGAGSRSGRGSLLPRAAPRPSVGGGSRPSVGGGVPRPPRSWS